MLAAGHGQETDPTWLEHTLEIKDDQNKGSQTGGENHPANPAHPHQVSQSLFHGRCCAAGLSVSLEAPRRTVCRSTSPTHPQRSVPLRGYLGVERGPTPLSGADGRVQLYPGASPHTRGGRTWTDLRRRYLNRLDVILESEPQQPCVN